MAGILIRHKLGETVNAMFPKPKNLVPPDPTVCISPADSRYWVPEIAALFAPVGEVAVWKAVEIALVMAQEHEGLCQSPAVSAVVKACLQVTAQEVAEEETRTQHNIDALVNCIKRYLDKCYHHLVHWMATSYDIISTSNAVILRDATEVVLIPALIELEKELIKRTLAEAEIATPGHTHLQQASPITMGFWYGQYVWRICERIRHLHRCILGLRGKFSGPVGCHNDAALVLGDPEAFEAQVLQYLGLEPAVYSTQITPPEPIADLMNAVVTTAGVLSDMANDIRILLMTEVGVLTRELDPGETGSSIMPQKVNPSRFETVCGLNRIMTGLSIVPLLNQESNLERDLRDSSAARIYGEMYNYVVYAARGLRRATAKLRTNQSRAQELLGMSKGQNMAAAWNTLLRKYGHPDAHGAMKGVAQEARQEGLWLHEVALADATLAEYVGRMTPEEESVLTNPAHYTGIAAEKARKVAQLAAADLGIEVNV